MRKNNIKNITAIIIATAITTMTAVMMTGCGSTFITQADMNESIFEDEMSGAPYFTDGVYANYPMDDENGSGDLFFAFDSSASGRTIDISHGGIGTPFDIEQTEGTVVFTSKDNGNQRVLTVTSSGNGIVKGTFDDGAEIVFERIGGVNANDFLAEYSVDDGGCYMAAGAVDSERLIMTASVQ